MANLNGHEGGNAGHGQGEPKKPSDGGKSQLGDGREVVVAISTGSALVFSGTWATGIATSSDIG